MISFDHNAPISSVVPPPFCPLSDQRRRCEATFAKLSRNTNSNGSYLTAEGSLNGGSRSAENESADEDVTGDEGLELYRKWWLIWFCWNMTRDASGRVVSWEWNNRIDFAWKLFVFRTKTVTVDAVVKTKFVWNSWVSADLWYPGKVWHGRLVQNWVMFQKCFLFVSSLEKLFRRLQCDTTYLNKVIGLLLIRPIELRSSTKFFEIPSG